MSIEWTKVTMFNVPFTEILKFLPTLEVKRCRMINKRLKLEIEPYWNKKFIRTWRTSRSSQPDGQISKIVIDMHSFQMPESLAPEITCHFEGRVDMFTVPATDVVHLTGIAPRRLRIENRLTYVDISGLTTKLQFIDAPTDIPSIEIIGHLFKSTERYYRLDKQIITVNVIGADRFISINDLKCKEELLSINYDICDVAVREEFKWIYIVGQDEICQWIVDNF